MSLVRSYIRPGSVFVGYGGVMCVLEIIKEHRSSHAQHHQGHTCFPSGVVRWDRSCVAPERVTRDLTRFRNQLPNQERRQG